MGSRLKKHLSGVELFSLKQFADDRGKVMHIMRADAPHFSQFGEVYCSFVNPHIIKGWKKHMLMEQNFAVPVGKVQFVLFDARPSSTTYKQYEEFILGEDPTSYKLLKIPPEIWYSFKCLADHPSMIVNCSSHVHEPNESISVDIHHPDIPYRWDLSSVS